MDPQRLRAFLVVGAELVFDGGSLEATSDPRGDAEDDLTDGTAAPGRLGAQPPLRTSG